MTNSKCEEKKEGKKTVNGTKLNNTNCETIWKLMFWQNSYTQNYDFFFKCDKSKHNSSYENIQKLILWQYSKTNNVEKTKISNCNKTQTPKTKLKSQRRCTQGRLLRSCNLYKILLCTPPGWAKRGWAGAFLFFG